MGLYRMRPEASDTPVQVWDGLFDGTTFGSLTLPPLVTSAGAPAGAAPPDLSFEWNNLVWVSWGSILYYWLGPSGTTWSAAQRTLFAAPTQAVVHINTGTPRVFVLQGTAIDYQTAGGAWARVTGTTASYGVSYNTFIWVIGTDGTFTRASIGTEAWGAWTSRQALPVGSGTVLGLLMYREPDGDPAIHAKTSEGLWAYDDTNDKWYPTELTYPRNPDALSGVDVWRGIGLPDAEMAGVHVAVGMGVYGYVARSGSPALVTALGLDLNDGVVSGYAGRIRRLVPSHNFNFALVEGTLTSSFDGATYGELEPSLGGADVGPGVTGRTWIAKYTGLGWFRDWTSAATSTIGNTLLVSQAYSKYRLYWDVDSTLYWMDLNRGILNPREATTTPRAAAGEVIWPWDQGSAEGQQDTLIEAVARVRGAGANETITVNYSTDLDDSGWTAPNTTGVISSNGRTVFTFGTSNRGVLFDFLRWRAQFARGSTTTNRPILEYLEYSFTPGVMPVLVWEATVDLRRDVNRRSTSTMLSTLIDLLDPQILREIVWRNQASTTEDVHQCKLVALEGAGVSGEYEQGVYKLTFEEPRP